MWVKVSRLIGSVIAHVSARSSFDKNEFFSAAKLHNNYGASGKSNNIENEKNIQNNSRN